MNMKVWWSIAVILFLVIVVLVLALILIPTPAHAPSSQGQASTTASTSSDPSPKPLHELVHVISPLPGQTVSHSLAVTGEAPGNWYFEATFPIRVTTPAGDVIGSGQCKAQSDWMTTSQVPFTATITLQSSYTGPATIVLMRDNPSGLPQNDDSLEIPISIQ